ncbi:MAG: 1-acyl-sn-glycerol-3-phosphate acyltransferase [Lachnospiraceae bacterium]|nr:1-acyl-sn-glycerol-3-phosphate acyltransferase [Lachnospiraceae bacterium]
MIRLILVSIFLIIFLVLSLPAMLVTWIIGRFNKHAGDVSSLWIVNKIGFRSVQFLAGVKTKVIGHDRIPDEPVLYICNHRGFFDTITSYQLVKNPTGYVAKKEILYAPILNLWMILLNCQFLDRKKPRSGMDMLLKSIELIKNGISVCIFPEGTRNRDAESDELLPFHAGSFKIATKTGCPIVPVTLINAGKVWEDHFPWMHGKNMVIEYGEPIYTKDMTKEELKNVSETTRDIIQKTYIKNKKEYAEFLNAR